MTQPSANNNRVDIKNYDFIAGIYDTLSEVYSLGQIRRAKLHQLNFLDAGQRVLFIGCGSGIEVFAAARRGCQVTAVDTSAKMLEKLSSRLKRHHLEANLVCDRFESMGPGRYDVVCPNFFLNCFPHDQMESLLRLALRRVNQGGRIMIADVAPPMGGYLSRMVNRAYLQFAMLPFWWMGLVHWHENHDYVQSLNQLGWVVDVEERLRMWRFGPVTFRNLIAVRETEWHGEPTAARHSMEEFAPSGLFKSSGTRANKTVAQR